MIVIYLDDSGEAADPFITLAGYLATTGEWKKFEAEARAYLEAFGVDHLHTVDLHRRRKAFDGWSREKVREFANGLFAILGKYSVVGMSFSVLKEVFNAKRVNLKREGAATTFCIKGIVARLLSNPVVVEILKWDGVDISIVLEKGNRHDGAIVKEFERISAMNGRFKSIALADKKSAIALQVADFLAYFSRRLLCLDRSHPRYDDERAFFDEVIKNVVNHDLFVATDFHVDEPY
uniref:DUF3800 domain-containing protein n=1 Tax=Caulobacter sp. (strain K31) TaxID=366602 RepID=B0T1Z1_CAUSK